VFYKGLAFFRGKERILTSHVVIYADVLNSKLNDAWKIQVQITRTVVASETVFVPDRTSKFRPS